MATPAVYKQSNVILSVNGVPVEDIAEDDAISVDFDRDRITKQLDINNGGLFSVRGGSPARISVPIMQHSRWIAILAGYKAAETMVTVSLEDKNDYDSAAMFITAHAMIQDVPVAYGTEASTRTYIFEIINLQEIILP